MNDNNKVRMLSLTGEDLINLIKVLSEDTEDKCECCGRQNESPEELDYATHDYIEPGDEDYVKSEHIVSLIEDITINTLSAEGTIALDSAKTLHILDDLRQSYLHAK